MDNYELVSIIGGGSFGQVYLAKHKVEGKHYALKKIKICDLSEKGRENTDNEIKLLQSFKHINIVGHKESFVDNEQLLNIVMTYCEGGDIYDKIRDANGKYFSEDQILDWFTQILLALHYLHEKRILHRDLKAQNIFLREGKVRLRNEVRFVWVTLVFQRF